MTARPPLETQVAPGSVDLLAMFGPWPVLDAAARLIGSLADTDKGECAFDLRRLADELAVIAQLTGYITRDRAAS